MQTKEYRVGISDSWWEVLKAEQLRRAIIQKKTAAQTKTKYKHVSISSILEEALSMYFKSKYKQIEAYTEVNEVNKDEK